MAIIDSEEREKIRRRRQRQIYRRLCILAESVVICILLVILIVMICHRVATHRENLTQNFTGGTEQLTDLADASTEDAPVKEPQSIEDVWADDPRTPVHVKGVYLSESAAITQSTVDYVIELLDETEINAVVITVKNDSGYLTVDLDVPLAEEIGAKDQLTFRDADAFRELLDTFREHGAYLIARIAAFRDGVLANAMTDCSLKWKEEYGGSLYCDNQGYYWLDPGNETVRQYLLDVSEATVALGFDEIQYDYVRFPTTYIGRVDYYGGSGYYVDEEEETYNIEAAELREETITSFIEYICRALVPEGVFVSADVYGTILLSDEDSGNVGQDYAAMAQWLDYICPMVYPSHYTNAVYGVEYPDTDPYTVVKGALGDSADRLAALDDAGEHCATVRPWLQAFTADWLEHYIAYSGTQLRDQINAVYDAGYSEWLVWRSNGDYTDYRSGLLNQ